MQAVADDAQKATDEISARTAGGMKERIKAWMGFRRSAETIERDLGRRVVQITHDTEKARQRIIEAGERETAAIRRQTAAARAGMVEGPAAERVRIQAITAERDAQLALLGDSEVNADRRKAIEEAAQVQIAMVYQAAEQRRAAFIRRNIREQRDQRTQLATTESESEAI